MECVRGANFDAKRGFETSDALTISLQSTDPGLQRVILAVTHFRDDDGDARPDRQPQHEVDHHDGIERRDAGDRAELVTPSPHPARP